MGALGRSIATEYDLMTAATSDLVEYMDTICLDNAWFAIPMFEVGGIE